MGMIGNLFRVTTDDLNKILNDSSILEEMVYSEDTSRMNQLLDLDKSWEGIFFLLTGYGIADLDKAQPPFVWILFSEQIVDEQQDMGYGPATYLNTDQVKQLNQALCKITCDELRQRYNGKQMNDAGIYPEVWDEEDALEYLIDYFEQLKEFYETAQHENNAVISFIN